MDDLLILAKDEEAIKSFKRSIGRTFNTKDLGEVSHILSIRVVRHEGGALTLDQTAYAEEILESFGMTSAKGAASPLDPGMKFQRSTTADEDRDLKPKYRQAVGALLYLAGGTRPDLAFATACMSQFSEHPTLQMWNGIKHILRYVQHTKNYTLTYTKTGGCVQGFCDADWANDTNDRRSFSGYIFMLAGAAISWSSKKQRSTALSSMEAEYLSMCQAAKEILWLQHFLNEIGAQEFVVEPQVLQVDNQGAIALASKQVTSERSKHIDLRHFFLREKIEEGRIRPLYVKSSDNCADALTKALNGRRTLELCEHWGLQMCNGCKGP